MSPTKIARASLVAPLALATLDRPERAATTIGRGWRWWLTERSPVIEARVFDGQPLALIGDAVDDLAAWARAIDPARPVFDLQAGRPVPTVGAVRRAFEACLLPIVIASRSERVTAGLGAAIQPYFMWTAPLSSRPGDAVGLLEAAMSEFASQAVALADLGWRGDELRGCAWRGLGDIRRTARLLAALVDETGNVTRAAARVGMSRQAFDRYLARRLVGERRVQRVAP